MRAVLIFALLCTLLGCGKDAKVVRIDLPIPPKLDLSSYDKVYFPGFIVVDKNKEFDTSYEAVNYFKREFIRREAIEVEEKTPIDLSDKDPRSFFERKQPFFSQIEVGNPDNTLAVTGVVSFEMRDRSGFREVSRTDLTGKRYSRAQFVEVTGYVLNFRIFVYDMKEGNMLYRETLRDGIDLEGPPDNAQLVFFDLAGRMTERIVGLFTSTNVKAERSLL